MHQLSANVPCTALTGHLSAVLSWSLSCLSWQQRLLSAQCRARRAPRTCAGVQHVQHAGGAPQVAQKVLAQAPPLHAGHAQQA